MPKLTIEEKLLVAIAKMTKGLPTEIDILSLTNTLPLSERQARKAVNLLARGNFIIKRGDTIVELTPHGIRVAKMIDKELEEK